MKLDIAGLKDLHRSRYDFREISKSDLVIFEGFEMVGKTTLLKRYIDYLSEFNIDFVAHRPDYDGVLKGLFNYETYYLAGLASAEALVRENHNFRQVVLDRSEPSNIAYSIGKCQTGSPLDTIVRAYEKLTEGLTVTVIHCCSDSYNDYRSARVKYDKATKSRKELSEYDYYKSFDSYLKDYKKFESIYNLVYSQYAPSHWNILKIDPYYL